MAQWKCGFQEGGSAHDPIIEERVERVTDPGKQPAIVPARTVHRKIVRADSSDNHTVSRSQASNPPMISAITNGSAMIAPRQPGSEIRNGRLSQGIG